MAADEVIVHRRAPVAFDRFYADHFDRTHAARLAGRRPVAVTAGYDEAERFWSLVRQLPTRQGHVGALFYAADLSVVEIAEALEVAEGTVKSHLHAARRRLAALLEVEEDVDA